MIIYNVCQSNAVLKIDALEFGVRARRHRNRVHLLVARNAITKLISLNSYTHTISDHRFFFVLSVLNCISFFIICSSPSSCLQSSIENMVLISGQFCCCYFATAIVCDCAYISRKERDEKKKAHWKLNANESKWRDRLKLITYTIYTRANTIIQVDLYVLHEFKTRKRDEWKVLFHYSLRPYSRAVPCSWRCVEIQFNQNEMPTSSSSCDSWFFINVFAACIFWFFVFHWHEMAEPIFLSTLFCIFIICNSFEMRQIHNFGMW